MLPVVRQRHMLEEHMPWIIMPNLIQCKYNLFNEDPPRLMCVVLRWCYIPFFNIAFQMRICHIRYVHAFAYVACHCHMLLT